MPDITQGPDTGPDQQQENPPAQNVTPPIYDPGPVSGPVVWTQVANFGSANAGQTVATALLDANMVAYEAPSVTGVAEYQMNGAGTGIYGCQFGLSPSFSGYTAFFLQSGPNAGQVQIFAVNLNITSSPTVVTDVL